MPPILARWGPDWGSQKEGQMLVARGMGPDVGMGMGPDRSKGQMWAEGSGQTGAGTRWGQQVGQDRSKGQMGCMGRGWWLLSCTPSPYVVPQGTPPSIQVWSQVRTGGSTPNRNSTACTCYAAGGRPLAFTQEHFLVYQF